MTTFLTHKRIVSAATALLISVAGFSAEGRDDSSFYGTLSQKSGSEVMAMAYAYLQDDATTDSALVCYSAVASRYGDRSLNDEETERCAFAMVDLGYMYYFYYFDYQKSYSYLTDALNIADKENFESVKALASLNLANLLRTYSENSIDAGLDERVTYYYKQSFRIAREEDNWRTALVAFYGLAHYVYMNEVANVITSEMETVRTAPIPEGTALLGTCRLFCDVLEAYRDGDYSEALRGLRMMIENNDAQDTPERYDIFALTKIARLQMITGENDKAITTLHEAEDIAEQYKAQDLKVGINKLYHDIYAAMGMQDTARVYLLRYHEAKELLVNGGGLLSYDRMHFLKELEDADERVSELRQQRRVYKIVTTVIVIGMAGLTILLIMLLHSYRKTRRAYEQLYRRSVEALAREDRCRNNAATVRQKGESTHPRTSDSIHPADIQERIDAVLADIGEICSPEFSLNRLAELTGQKYWNMSQIIKDTYGKNFYMLLNEHRIKEACRRINDREKYGNYTIEAISASVGFKSRSNFITTFKTITGLTPSEYQKIAKRTVS